MKCHLLLFLLTLCYPSIVFADGGWVTIDRSSFGPGGLDNNTFAHTTLHGSLPITGSTGQQISGPLILTNDVNAQYSVNISSCASLNNGEATIGTNQHDNGTGGTGRELKPGESAKFDLPYQTPGQPITMVYFAVQYWDPNKKPTPPLSGAYKGTYQSTDSKGASFSDPHVYLVILNTGQETLAYITYTDSAGTYQETCKVTTNKDGSFTLTGIACNVIVGSNQFSLDVFLLKYNEDGTLTGTATDAAGNTSTLSLNKP